MTGAAILYEFTVHRRKGAGLVLLGAMLLAGGLALALSWLRQIASRRRFGAAELRLDAVPVTPGSVLQATVRVPRVAVPAGDWEWTLTCLGRTDRQGEESSFESLIWRDEYRGETAEVRFAIPVSAPARTPDRQSGSRTIRWKLEVRAGQFRAKFDVPVFDGPVAVGQPMGRPDAAAPQRPPHRLEAVKIRRDEGGLLVVEFRRGRKRKLSVASGMFGVILAVAMLVQRDLGAPWVMQAITALVALLLGWIFAGSLLSWSRVEADSQGLRIRKGWGSRGSVEILEPAEVSSIEAEANGRAGGRVFYDVVVRTRWGRKKRLGGGISRGDADEVVLALIERVAGSSRRKERGHET
jgi:hypothetical protein